MKILIALLMLTLVTDAFAWGKRSRRSSFSRRSSRSFFKKKPSRKVFKRKKTVKPVYKKRVIKPLRKKTVKTPKKRTKVIHKTTVIHNNNTRYGSGGSGMLDMYINYKIMQMVLNPRTGQMECPRGSLLNTQTNQCVSQQPVQPTQAAPIQNNQPSSTRTNDFEDSDTI